MKMRIRCAICDKLVDRTFQWTEEFERKLIIKVRCHGSEDEMEITATELHFLDRNFMAEIQAGRIEGLAFATDGRRVIANEHLSDKLMLPSPADG